MKLFEIPAGDSIQSVVERSHLDLRDPSAYLLFPDIPVISQVEKLFLSHGLWGERLLTFSKLASVANLRGDRKFIEISPMGRLFLMEETVRDLTGGLSYYRDIANIKGFSEALVRDAAELKHMKLTFDIIFETANRIEDKKLKNKLEDLGNILKLYQKKLDEEELVDDIDRLRLLSQTVTNGGLINILPGIQSLIVFGFYDFTPSQLEVLKRIDDSGCELLVYLPLLDGYPNLRAESLGKFRDWFGDLDIRKYVESSEPQKEVIINSFPSFREEAEFIAREVKKLILENSFKPDEIALVSRSLSEKENYLIRAFEKHGIPCLISEGFSLRANSLGQFVLNLLNLKSNDYERRLFIDFLTSPYLAGFFEKMDEYEELVWELDLESRKRRIVGGLEGWRGLLEEFPHSRFSRGVQDILGKIDKRFNSNSLGEFCEDMGEILGELSVNESVEKLFLKSFTYLSAWVSLVGFIKELRFLSKIRFKKSVEKLDDFIALLEDLLYEQNFSASTPSESESVRVMEAHNALGTVFPVVFILDVGESVFPSPLVRDPIIKNDERTAINQALGKNLFRLEKNHYENEEFLFKTICDSSSAKLYISYSYLDEKERSKLPSYLVDEMAYKEKIEAKRYKMEDELLEPLNIYSKNDLAKHLFYTKRDKEAVFSEYLKSNWKPYKWVVAGIHAENSRLIPVGSYSLFEGIITRKDLLPDRIKYSPTRLETYGECPFKYFAGTVLGLEELEEVEEEVPVLELGGFYHKVLKEFFSGLAGEMKGRVDLRKIDDEHLTAKLREVISKLDFSKEFPALTSSVAEVMRTRVLNEVLPRFILTEAGRIREWNDKGFYPAFFEKELKFSIGGINFKGVADRVDFGQKEALIIDYKLRSPWNKHFFSFKNLQLPLYLYALKQEGFNPYGGYYRFVERPDDEVGTNKERKDSIDESINSAISQSEMYINLIDRGFFAPVIDDKEPEFEERDMELRKDDHSPCGYCSFSNLCRVTEGIIRRL